MGSPYVNFLEEINSLTESDYGDFMRKVNHYLLELKMKPSTVMTPEIANKLAAIQSYIEFLPSWDIPSTREKLTKDVEQLIHMEATGSL